MEANYREDCDFEHDRLGEIWRITRCWKIQYDGSIAWWEGECVRGGVKFHRLFRPSEVVPPNIKYDTTDSGIKECLNIREIEAANQ